MTTWYIRTLIMEKYNFAPSSIFDESLKRYHPPGEQQSSINSDGLFFVRRGDVAIYFP